LTAKDLVTTSYTARGIANHMGGSYGDLITNKVVDADGFILSQTYGDIAKTTATNKPNARRLLGELTIARAAPSIWNLSTAPPGYLPPIGSTPTTLQTVLQDLTFRLRPGEQPMAVADGRIEKGMAGRCKAGFPSNVLR